MIVEQISLHFQSGNSDKVYFAQIKELAANSYQVDFQYGRRGAALTTGSKTSGVDFATAKKVYDKLVKEKTGKGYLVTANTGNNLPAQNTAPAVVSAPPQVKVIDVQLLNEVEESELEALFRNPNIGAQEKYDGERRVLKYTKGIIIGYNRNGFALSIPQILADDVIKLPISDFVIDGEIVGDTFYAFDCLSFKGRDIMSEAFFNRSIMLGGFGANQPNIVFAPLAVTEQEKRELYAKLKAEGKEGIVFKELNAPYTGGRPNSGGKQLKFKFWASATCRVKQVNGTKRSVAVEVLDANGNYLEMGNCTIPANQQIPTAGTFVEIRYLYAYKNGSLYQPIYKGARTDKSEADTYESLKFKAAATN